MLPGDRNTLADKLGIADAVRVGVVAFGDAPVRPARRPAGRRGGVGPRTIEDFRSETMRDSVLSANAYIGCAGIVQALKLGANVIVGGRLTDTALALGPLVHEFGWSEDDWDRRASGLVAGHIIECGPQCTGGNFTDWRSVDRTAPIGYPIIEASPDGSFVVTKHPGSGGLVTVETVSEQLLYEIGAAFRIPVAGRRGPLRLRPAGATGPRPRFSVSGVRLRRATARDVEGLRPAMRTATASSGGSSFRARTLLPRLRRPRTSSGRPQVGRTCTSRRAHSSSVGTPHTPALRDVRAGAFVQVAARDQARSKLEERFAPFVVGTGLGSVPGFGLPADQGRPRVSEVVGYWPAFIGSEHIEVEVLVDGRKETLAASPGVATRQPPVAPAPALPLPPCGGEMVDVALVELCLARSGDKGDTCNVGVIARSDAIFSWMLEHLNTDFVKEHFGGVCRGAVERHIYPNLRSQLPPRGEPRWWRHELHSARRAGEDLCAVPPRRSGDRRREAPELGLMKDLRGRLRQIARQMRRRGASSFPKATTRESAVPPTSWPGAVSRGSDPAL